MKDDLAEKGVIFVGSTEGLKDHPEILKNGSEKSYLHLIISFLSQQCGFQWRKLHICSSRC